MDRQMAGYEYLARLLKENGTTHVFHIEAMLRMTIKELEELGVQAVMAHSENGAGYMADGYARISGKPGIVMAQSIGAANLTGGVEDAYLAGSPVIALTGKKIPLHQYRNSYQESDHRLFYEAITKFNAEVSIADQLPYLMRQCFRSVTTGKPGPAHLDIPNRMGRTMEVASIQEPFAANPEYGIYPAIRPSASEAEVAEAAKAIADSQRPVILAGRGARLSNAGKEIVDLAKKGDIPIITSPDGKTLMDETDPLWAGISGEYGMDCANRALRNADLVIFIGTQTNDQTTYNWKCPPTETRIIQIDIEASELGRNYPDTIGLPGDAKVVTNQLLNKIEVLKHKSWRAEVADYIKETMKENKVYMESMNLPMRPERLSVELSKVLPDNAALVADTGYAAVWSATMTRMKSSQNYLRAAGSLGWSFPASLGVKCAVPDRPVICFTGDAGFYYHLSEMETAVRYGINTVTVINNNGVVAQCQTDIKNIFKNEPEKAKRHITFTETNFSKLAEVMGCYSTRVTRIKDVGPAIEEALNIGRPAIIEVITDSTAVTPPPLKLR